MRLGRPFDARRHQRGPRAQPISRSNGDTSAWARRCGSDRLQYDDAVGRRAPAAAGAAVGRPPGDPQPRHRLRQHRARRPVGRAARGRLLPGRHAWWSPAPRARREIPAAEFFTGAMTTVDAARGAARPRSGFPVAGTARASGSASSPAGTATSPWRAWPFGCAPTMPRARRPGDLLRHLRPPGHPRRLRAAARSTGHHRHGPRRARPAPGAGADHADGSPIDVVDTGGDATPARRTADSSIAGSGRPARSPGPT